MSMPEKIAAAWEETVKALGAAPDAPAAREWGARFIEAYQEPYRAYHNLAHLAALLARLEAWADRAEDAPLLRLTAFAHDAVYHGAPGRDERESAALARRCGAELGLAPGRIEAMARWIEATAGHAPQEDDDGRLFLDADLEILAAPPEIYDAYAAAIRQEYAAVPEAMFRAGRRAALQAFLERPAIYLHAGAPEEWERRARGNLAREIAALT